MRSESTSGMTAHADMTGVRALMGDRRHRYQTMGMVRYSG